VRDTNPERERHFLLDQLHVVDIGRLVNLITNYEDDGCFSSCLTFERFKDQVFAEYTFGLYSDDETRQFIEHIINNNFLN
jgi:hypothetical protein